MPVDASSASFPDGTAGIVAGARVEVSGTIVEGVLVATPVELERTAMGGDMRSRMPFEFHGAISGLDTGSKTFALRDMTIWYGGPSNTQRQRGGPGQRPACRGQGRDRPRPHSASRRAGSISSPESSRGLRATRRPPPGPRDRRRPIPGRRPRHPRPRAAGAARRAGARVLAPLARLAVARGLPFAAAEEMLKQAFVRCCRGGPPGARASTAA